MCLEGAGIDLEQLSVVHVVAVAVAGCRYQLEVLWMEFGQKGDGSFQECVCLGQAGIQQRNLPTLS